MNVTQQRDRTTVESVQTKSVVVDSVDRAPDEASGIETHAAMSEAADYLEYGAD